MATLEKEEERAEVPKHEELLLGDELRHTNELYTQMRREGALPMNIVVIPDTKNMYNEAENGNVFDLYEVGNLKREEESLPFIHGVELAGPKGEIVRF